MARVEAQEERGGVSESLFSSREVRERGWPTATFRARVEHRTKRGKDQWRFVVEREYVHRRACKWSRWRGDLTKTVALANRWLDCHDEDYAKDNAQIEGYV